MLCYIYILKLQLNEVATCEAQPLYTACWNLHTIYGYVLELEQSLQILGRFEG